LNWNETAAGFMALLGVVLLLYRRELSGLAPAAGRVTLSASAVLLVGAGVLWFAVADEHRASDLLAGNPVKPTEASVSRGRMLFEQNCVVCHGADGRGDGEAAADLNPQPTDFRLHMPNHTDPDFFDFIADGYPGSAMPEFRAAFSEEDIWNLVNFLRASFSEAPSQ
jgi:mono/diheme cytochrome c family protein